MFVRHDCRQALAAVWPSTDATHTAAAAAAAAAAACFPK